MQKTSNLKQIGCFFDQIFQNTTNFAHWVFKGYPPIDIPKKTKKAPKKATLLYKVTPVYGYGIEHFQNAMVFSFLF